MFVRTLAAAVVLIGSLVMAVPAIGQDLSGFTCFSFGVQEDAQAIFDGDPGGQAALDPDGNRIACEELPLRGAPPPTPEIPQDILDNPPAAPPADDSTVSRGRGNPGDPGDPGVPSSPAGETATTAPGTAAPGQSDVTSPGFGTATTTPPAGSGGQRATANIGESSDSSTLVIGMLLLPVLALLVLLYIRRRNDPEVE
jgi:hypothetical protein